jgi:hypothetical protein
MKLFKPLLLLLITLIKAYSQEASIKHTNFLPASKQVQHSQNLNYKKAFPFMQKPYDLLNYWGDQTLPLAQYSEKEKAFQQHLNQVLSADFVLSYSPESVGFEVDNYNLPLHERNIDNEPITPYTWKWVSLELIHEDGSKDEVKLCRPNWWLNNLGANKVGEKVYLDIPETGINGTALVTKILPCQLDTRLLHEKREGDYVYRPITATFKHQSAEVWDFTFTGDETVGATNNHPFYSLDRQDYIPVGELRIGERVKNFAGTEIKLLSKAKRPNPEPVYNLEVYRNHNYLVGKGRILVHNTCGPFPLVGGANLFERDGVVEIIDRVGKKVSFGSLFPYKGKSLLEMTIVTKNSPTSGRTTIKETIKYMEETWEEAIEGFHVKWVKANGLSDNIDTFNEKFNLYKSSYPEKQAMKKAYLDTFSGKMAVENGFTNIDDIVGTKDTNGLFIAIEAFVIK